MDVTRDIANKVTSSLATTDWKNIGGWFAKDPNAGMQTISSLSENELLNMADDINSLFSESNITEDRPELSLPKLVVVGTQSSGKSTVLNKIIGMDILPTGKNMVTRTPLELRLHKTKTTMNQQQSWAEFGEYTSNGWEIYKKIPLDVPLPSEEQTNNLRDTIEQQTIKIAGQGMNINETPIILNIYSPHVPNLSLTDLPGLTMVAQTDRGQPADIKQRIEKLAIKYIKNPRTIVITVMAARPDMEADVGLALVKKYDKNGQRTVGVLTKPDLMNYDTHVGDYLLGNISRNLMLTHGYYVLKNRSDKEAQTYDAKEAIVLEKTYFDEHIEYSKPIYSERVGCGKLTTNLNSILVSAISELLPQTLGELASLEISVNGKLEKMGTGLPETREGKIGLLNRWVTEYNNQVHDSIESRGKWVNCGKSIKDIFENFKRELKQMDPFTKPHYNMDYFSGIISSFEGNRMVFQVNLIQVLESCMTDPRYNPILKLGDRCAGCVDEICDCLTGLFRDIGKGEQFNQYPPLRDHVLSCLSEHLISTVRAETKAEVRDIVKCENSYIWTDDQEFRNIITGISQEHGKSLNEGSIRKLLQAYFVTVKESLANSIPKRIMFRIVRKIQQDLLSTLFANIVSDNSIPLLKEDDDIEKKREYYSGLQTKIVNIKKTLHK